MQIALLLKSRNSFCFNTNENSFHFLDESLSNMQILAVEYQIPCQGYTELAIQPFPMSQANRFISFTVNHFLAIGSHAYYDMHHY